MKQIILFLTQLVVCNRGHSFAYLRPFCRPLIHKYPENAWNMIPAEIEPKILYPVLYSSFTVKKMDMNETIEGIADKWALLGEPFEAEVCYAFGWEVGVESLYDGLQGAKAMKTRGAVGEKLKYH